MTQPENFFFIRMRSEQRPFNAVFCLISDAWRFADVRIRTVHIHYQPQTVRSNTEGKRSK